MIFNSQSICVALGAYLKEKRLRANKSQAEVAESLGYSSAQFISNMERGTCAPPMPVLKEMMKLYKISTKEVTDLLLKLQREHLRQEFRKSS